MTSLDSKPRLTLAERWDYQPMRAQLKCLEDKYGTSEITLEWDLPSLSLDSLMRAEQANFLRDLFLQNQKASDAVKAENGRGGGRGAGRVILGFSQRFTEAFRGLIVNDPTYYAPQTAQILTEVEFTYQLLPTVTAFLADLYAQAGRYFPSNLEALEFLVFCMQVAVADQTDPEVTRSAVADTLYHLIFENDAGLGSAFTPKAVRERIRAKIENAAPPGQLQKELRDYRVELLSRPWVPLGSEQKEKTEQKERAPGRRTLTEVITREIEHRSPKRGSPSRGLLHRGRAPTRDPRFAPNYNECFSLS